MGTAALLATGGDDATFYAVFAVFLAAFLVLVVVTLRWAVRRDRAGRAEWIRRQASAAAEGAAGAGAAGAGAKGGAARPAASGAAGRVQPPQTNGHAPRRKGQRKDLRRRG